MAHHQLLSPPTSRDTYAPLLSPAREQGLGAWDSQEVPRLLVNRGPTVLKSGPG